MKNLDVIWSDLCRTINKRTHRNRGRLVDNDQIVVNVDNLDLLWRHRNFMSGKEKKTCFTVVTFLLNLGRKVFKRVLVATTSNSLSNIMTYLKESSIKHIKLQPKMWKNKYWATTGFDPGTLSIYLNAIDLTDFYTKSS